jgi:hypothetical protein
MKLKIFQTYISIFIFISFIFLWGLNISIYVGDVVLFNKYDFLKENIFVSAGKFQIFAAYKYFILLLVFPIFFNLFKEIKSISINKVFNNQKFIILLVLFVVLHFFLLNIWNNETIETIELIKIILFILISIIFVHYRLFLKNHFEHILTFFLIIFIFFSFYGSENPDFNIGECNNSSLGFYYYLHNKFNLTISSGVFIENSHLSMMMVAVIFSIILKITMSKKINFFYILMFFLSTIILLFNYSTTFFICYLISFITIAIFLHKKISIKFWVLSFLFLSLNGFIFLGDKNCTKKIYDVNIKHVIEKKINKMHDSRVGKNLTTQIYERSAIVTLNTFQKHPLGWGFDGMDEATTNLINQPRYINEEMFIGDGTTKIFNLKNQVFSYRGDIFTVILDTVDGREERRKFDAQAKVAQYTLGILRQRGTDKDYTLGFDENNIVKKIIFKNAPKSGDIIHTRKNIVTLAKILNLNDGLSNFFKILNEFGIFSLFILYFFVRYLLTLKNIETYNIFIIILFVTLSIRGAGYFNGAFIFCLLEFFYIKQISNKKLDTLL